MTNVNTHTIRLKYLDNNNNNEQRKKTCTPHTHGKHRIFFNKIKQKVRIENDKLSSTEIHLDRQQKNDTNTCKQSESKKKNET